MPIVLKAGAGLGVRQPPLLPPPGHACEPPPSRAPPCLQELRAGGLEPYAYTFARTHSAAELQALHAGLGDGEVAEGEVAVAVAGRVMSRRFMGKLAFFSLVDASGSIQVRGYFQGVGLVGWVRWVAVL